MQWALLMVTSLHIWAMTVVGLLLSFLKRYQLEHAPPMARMLLFGHRRQPTVGCIDLLRGRAMQQLIRFSWLERQ